MITKISSTYPIWLKPIPKMGIAGRWLNLANLEEMTFNNNDCHYWISLASGKQRAIPNEWATQIADEFREMVRERRSPPLPKATE